MSAVALYIIIYVEKNDDDYTATPISVFFSQPFSASDDKESAARYVVYYVYGARYIYFLNAERGGIYIEWLTDKPLPRGFYTAEKRAERSRSTRARAR